MSISMLPLFLMTVGVAWNFPWNNHGNEDGYQPIMSSSNERRICVELCIAGLGGETCGKDCLDLTPLSLQVQSVSLLQNDKKKNLNATKEILISKPRIESCDVLCKNNLGFPLCKDKCNQTKASQEKTDFVEICAYFCVNYDYQIFGCQKCEIYKNVHQLLLPKLLINKKKSLNMMSSEVTLTPFWTKWCVSKCSEGEGGSACNCDKPVMAKLT